MVVPTLGFGSVAHAAGHDPDLNQAPTAEGEEAPQLPPAPPQPNLPVIPEEIRARLERRVRLLGRKAGVVVDAPLINEVVRHVMGDLEIDLDNRLELEDLLNSLLSKETTVDPIIRIFLRERRNR